MRRYRHPMFINEYEDASEPAFFRAMVPVTQLVTLLHLGRVDRREHPFWDADGWRKIAMGTRNRHEAVGEHLVYIMQDITDRMTQTAVEVMPKLDAHWKTGLRERYAGVREDPRTLAWLEEADRTGRKVDRGETPSMMIVSGIRVGVTALASFAMLKHHPSGLGKNIDAAQLGQFASGTDSDGLTHALNDLALADWTGNVGHVADPEGWNGLSEGFLETVAVRGAPGCPARKAVRRDVVALLEGHGHPVSAELRSRSPIQSVGLRVRACIDGLMDGVIDDGIRSPS